MFRVFWKYTEGTLSVKVYEEDHWQNVKGMASHNLKAAGYAHCWQVNSTSSVQAISDAMKSESIIAENSLIERLTPAS